MSRSKQKGTAWETAVVNFLHGNGYPHVERRALNGVLDRGDIAGIPDVVIECKAHRQIDLAEFMDETETERRNAGAAYGVCVVKRRMKGVEASYSVLRTDDLFALLKRAGF